MKDRDFLILIHERLEYVHKESPNYDYMHQLRNIISVYPKNKETPNIMKYNSIEELKNK